MLLALTSPTLFLSTFQSRTKKKKKRGSAKTRNIEASKHQKKLAPISADTKITTTIHHDSSSAQPHAPLSSEATRLSIGRGQNRIMSRKGHPRSTLPRLPSPSSKTTAKVAIQLQLRHTHDCPPLLSLPRSTDKKKTLTFPKNYMAKKSRQSPPNATGHSSIHSFIRRSSCDVPEKLHSEKRENATSPPNAPKGPFTGRLFIHSSAVFRAQRGGIDIGELNWKAWL